MNCAVVVVALVPYRSAAVADKAMRSLFARSKQYFLFFFAAVVVGIVGGLLSAAFLGSLNWATTTRINSEWLIFLLPIGGGLVGFTYYKWGHPITGGTSLVLDAIHVPGAKVPARMAPMIWTGSVASHLVGASVGREGAIVQITASVTDAIARARSASDSTRRVFLVIAVAAGFGGLFGVPIAGAFFGLEIQRKTRLHKSAVLPAFAASAIAFFTVEACGVKHFATPNIESLHFGWSVLWRCLVASCVFALIAIAYIQLEHRIKNAMAQIIKFPPLRPVVGGCIILALTALSGTRAYLGISTSLLESALTGAVGIAALACLWKLLFTAVSLGTGFVGGEVFPLFIIGALAGAQFARVTHASIPLFAALGLIAVFAAASNTPLTCIVIGIELFGWNALPAYCIVCILAYQLSGKHTIYKSSPIAQNLVV
ncbi:MAG: chloride channel protein [Ilumatobacteraceae bacterium]|nr:chloride channel protein [Ilumatobacteraceae bacterium]